jgi:hypothetical protein
MIPPASFRLPVHLQSCCIRSGRTYKLTGAPLFGASRFKHNKKCGPEVHRQLYSRTTLFC